MVYSIGPDRQVWPRKRRTKLVYSVWRHPHHSQRSPHCNPDERWSLRSVRYSSLRIVYGHRARFDTRLEIDYCQSNVLPSRHVDHRSMFLRKYVVLGIERRRPMGVNADELRFHRQCVLQQEGSPTYHIDFSPSRIESNRCIREACLSVLVTRIDLFLPRNRCNVVDWQHGISNHLWSAHTYWSVQLCYWLASVPSPVVFWFHRSIDHMRISRDILLESMGNVRCHCRWLMHPTDDSRWTIR